MGSQALLVDAALEVLQDLRLRRPQPRPVRVQIERIRIQVRLYVARQPRIGVDPPRSADAVFPVEDGEVPKARSRQQYPQRDAAGAGADNADRKPCRPLSVKYWPPST